MENSDLADAYAAFSEDLLFEAQASGDPKHEVFFRKYLALAVDNGDCPDLQYTPARRDGRGGYQVDGWSIDADRGELFLAVCDYHQEDELQQLHSADLTSLMQRAKKLYELSLDASFINSLEEVSPTFDVAYPIHDAAEKIKRIRVVIFSNARLSTRSVPKVDAEIAGVPVICNLLDFVRYAEIDRSRSGSEPIEVDILDLNGAALPCLPAHSESEEYEAYLIAMPGSLLAKIYGLYGARLLEQNVRTFLQARTKVNAGIINTLTTTPWMFFAYNNGLTATASGLKTTRLQDGSLGLASLKNLQIVNGGQTTASILYAQDQGKADLSRVFVQMKLSVVKPELVETIVPKISRYANTQNRISEADFASSDAFQVYVEKTSRRLIAPAKAGHLTGSKWFYERARGQYKDAQAYKTPAERRKFELEYPKAQLIDKTDLAKYEMTWRCAPNVVSLGAQKCFLEFADLVDEEWVKDELAFNDDYYKRAVAKAILFRATDQMVGSSDWYQATRGWKAQIVTYSIAWLLKKIRSSTGEDLNLMLLWQAQDIPEALRQTLTALTPLVAATINAAPAHVKNVGEYCKKEECWSAVQKTDYDVPFKLSGLLIGKAAQREDARDASKVRRIDKQIELDVLFMKLAPSAGRILELARAKGYWSPKSDAALKKLARNSIDLSSSEKNALGYLLERLRGDGVEGLE